MTQNVYYVLAGIALVLGVVGLVRPAWPALGVAIILLAVDLLIH